MPRIERIPGIISLGRAVGSNKMTNADMDAFLGLKRPGTTARLMREVGIEERYWVKRGVEATSDIAAEALEEALGKAGIDRSQLKGLWLATSSPDRLGVSTVAMVQEKLGLPQNMLGSNNADACPGWIMALYKSFTDLTSPYGRGGPQAVIGAEVTSTSLSRKKGVVSSLFGDAAGAAIIDIVEPDEGAPTNIGFAFGLDGRYAEELGIEAGGSKKPATHWTIRKDKHGIHMNGGLIFEQATTRMPQVAQAALEEAGITPEQVGRLVVHQANEKIIRVSAERLGIPAEKVVITIDRYGNTSAASIPTALYEAWMNGEIGRNDIVAMASFGAGLVYNAAVIPMVGLPRRK